MFCASNEESRKVKESTRKLKAGEVLEVLEGQDPRGYRLDQDEMQS